ncbi:MAG: hypothetical protein WC256_08830, partial [Desulfurivibrionaceae bacterium]
PTLFRSLYYDQANLATRVSNIEQFLDTSATALGVLSTLNSDLKKLEIAVTTLNKTAEAAQAIPQAREKVKKIKDTLAVTQKNITVARQRMDAIVVKTDPIRIKMSAAAEKAKALKMAIIGINDGLIKNIPGAASKTQACLGSLPAEKLNCATTNVNNSANNVDHVLVDYDRVVKGLLYTPEPWLPSMSFFDPFNTDLREIDRLRTEIEALYDRVNGLAKQLSALNGVLDQSFSFSFPYPNPTWTNPARFSDYTVSIGFRTIIQGSNAIEKEIEHILSGFLWKILKGLGVGHYVDSLIDQANNAMNSALNAVNLNISLDLPDMSALGAFEQAELTLMAQLDALKFPTVGTELPGFGFPGTNPQMNFNIFGGSFPNGLNLNTCDALTTGCN